MGPKVTIIIPFYNCPYVDQALESAVNQTYENIEILLIDDGSTQFTEKITPYSKEINYIRKENGGTASALNTGIQSASGEYVAWLSSDDVFMPEKISKQLSFILTNQADMAFTNYHIIDAEKQAVVNWACPRFATVKDIYHAYLTFNAINGCTVLIKKKIFENIGEFDLNFRYTHDYEMWMRILVNGYKVHYQDEALTMFRQHNQSGTSKHQKEMLNEMKVIEGIYLPKMKELIKRL
ncbi:glycosyltransferase family 2 protein [Cytobacillus purgationiresistens]|uniref:Glycosyltransferase involved in cell wall biosynthesis n=1 Tax=Cytobacillus purgationiresistens TaxID=863449 RepID=A0ABU0AEP7_9BACI|nr:glycosyltransferase [Cytobacillus purgationiresistens]MDQ0269723.1 glycosyltransferase involved in cell wall biosynthesis [Cytobacillus purgationiresistens]